MGGFRAAGVRFNYRGRTPFLFVEIRLSRESAHANSNSFPTTSPPLPSLELNYSRRESKDLQRASIMGGERGWFEKTTFSFLFFFSPLPLLIHESERT